MRRLSEVECPGIEVEMKSEIAAQQANTALDLVVSSKVTFTIVKNWKGHLFERRVHRPTARHPPALLRRRRHPDMRALSSRFARRSAVSLALPQDHILRTYNSRRSSCFTKAANLGMVQSWRKWKRPPQRWLPREARKNDPLPRSSNARCILIRLLERAHHWSKYRACPNARSSEKP